MTAVLPDRTRIVVIGGGVAGASIAYHLAAAGERDVLLLERAELTSGSTFHSAGMVGQLRADPTLTRMNMYSVELYRTLQAGAQPPGWMETGSIRLASSPERLQELRRQLSWARVAGLPMELIGPGEVAELFPAVSLGGVVGGVFLPTDGYLDPSGLCYSLVAGARAAGVRISQHTKVVGLDITGGRVRAVRTDSGDVECESAVIAGGMFAAELGRLAGIRVPVLPMSHQYLVTEPIAGLPDGLPSLRDPDLLVYYRPEGPGLLVGGYERTAAPFAAGPDRFDAVPADFNGKLLPEDWDRFAEIMQNAQMRVPALAATGIRRVLNGPEAFTPDNEFCLGETAVDGLFVAAGFCAHGIAGAGGVGRLMAGWMLTGRCPDNVWHMDISRFGAAYGSPSFTLARTVENYQTYYDIRYPGHERRAGRPLRRSPAYPWHLANGAVFGEKSGWERVLYYAPNAAAGPEIDSPKGWAGADFSPAVAAEQVACRSGVALFDESSFAKISVSGPDAAAFLQWVCDNDVARDIGAVTYTQLLDEGGGIQADLTVTRVDEDAFWLVTGTAFGSHDLQWLRRLARRTASTVRIDDISGQYGCYAVWGPRAREFLAPLTPADLTNAGFGYMTSAMITVGDVPVRALRTTYVGELGWELYPSAEYGAALWELLVSAGTDPGLMPGGYRAIESLRLEKGYRAWGSDITPETNPLEAGLGFCVAWDKPGGFLGREALLAVRANGPDRRLCALILDDPGSMVLGGEPVRRAGTTGGQVLGRVTSGGFGYTLNASIAYAYLPVVAAAAGTEVEIDLFGEWMAARVTRSLFDPKGLRVRA